MIATKKTTKSEIDKNKIRDLQKRLKTIEQNVKELENRTKLNERSSILISKHMVRADLKQLVNKVRVCGRNTHNINNLRKSWSKYNDMKKAA